MQLKAPSRSTVRVPLLAFTTMVCLLVTGAALHVRAQTLGSTDRERGRVMLKTIKEDIKKNYYDSNFHGVDLETHFSAAEEKIKTAASLGQVFGIIAQAMVELKDSHTYFTPPPRTTSTEYGWQVQMIGDKCYVTSIKPGSDAEAKEVKQGDEVISVNGVGMSRQSLWRMRYLYYTLAPRPGLRVVVQSPNGEEREVDILAKVKEGKKIVDLTEYDEVRDLVREAQNESRLNAHRFYENIEDVFIWKMPQFDLPESKVDDLMGKANKRKALILDLRGNGGGDEVTMLRLIGNLFDKDIKVGEIKRRKEVKPLIAKTRGNNAFKGQVVLLIDSESGSAAEVLARVIQLEKRGAVIGDLSAGVVMRSRYYGHRLGVDIATFYGSHITDADLLMTDGKSLENVGVTPDELVLPMARDLERGRDTVLSRAATLVGLKMEPEKAGTLFPIQWAK